CWGYAKRLYHMKDRSFSEADLEQNVLDSLNVVPQSSMQRFFIRSGRFVNAYKKGLDGKQAAWAIKRY
ncbi:uncharacterized protein F5147DRAFT_583592, partial [Suillus discolor]